MLKRFKINDVVIIGAGPAGISAAIQLKRYGIGPVLLEKEEVGGILRNANLVENYLGFPDGISGPELLNLFKKQLKNAGVEVHFETVLRLEYKNKFFYVNTDQRELISRIVIIASGTKPRNLPDLDIPKGIEDRIFCEIYPLIRVGNKKIVIIGAGDSAFDYALNLSKGNDVTILNRAKKPKCLPLLWKKAMETNNISYLATTSIKKIKSHNDGLILTCCNTMNEWEIPASYLVIAIGRQPSLDFLSETLAKDLKRLEEMKTLHLIGDVKNGIYRQTAIAVGDGIKTAMEIYKKLKEQNL